MTRSDSISKLEELMEEISWAPDLTDYAIEKAYIKLDSALEYLEENEDI